MGTVRSLSLPAPGHASSFHMFMSKRYFYSVARLSVVDLRDVYYLILLGVQSEQGRSEKSESIVAIGMWSLNNGQDMADGDCREGREGIYELKCHKFLKAFMELV